MTEQQAPQTRVITHRGAEYQVHVAPAPGAPADSAKYLHAQNLDGGVGIVVPFDHEQARAFYRSAPDDLRAVGYESDDEPEPAKAVNAAPAPYAAPTF